MYQRKKRRPSTEVIRKCKKIINNKKPIHTCTRFVNASRQMSFYIVSAIQAQLRFKIAFLQLSAAVYNFPSLVLVTYLLG